MTAADMPYPAVAVVYTTGNKPDSNSTASVGGKWFPYTALQLPKLIKTATGDDVPGSGVHTQFAVGDDAKVTNFVQRRDELAFCQQRWRTDLR